MAEFLNHVAKLWINLFTIYEKKNESKCNNFFCLILVISDKTSLNLA